MWDSMAYMTLLVLCLAGWNVGLINSWRGPIAMLIATIVTQQFYIDFATWICQQTFVNPAFSTFIAYLMMWLVADIVVELAMTLGLVWGIKERPRIYDRVGGVMLAIIRWLVICTFPLMAMNTVNKVPEPPARTDDFVNPLKIAEIEESPVLAYMAGIGKSLMPVLGGIVVSEKEPSFKPDWIKPKIDLR